MLLVQIGWDVFCSIIFLSFDRDLLWKKNLEGDMLEYICLPVYVQQIVRFYLFFSGTGKRINAAVFCIKYFS